MFSLFLPDRLGTIFPLCFANHTLEFLPMENNPQRHPKHFLTFNGMHEDTQTQVHFIPSTETDGQIDVQTLTANLPWVHGSSSSLRQTSAIHVLLCHIRVAKQQHRTDIAMNRGETVCLWVTYSIKMQGKKMYPGHLGQIQILV